jgi:membrane associated rhomboid family serine protease
MSGLAPGKRLVNPSRERVFNIPPPVLLTAAALVAVHAVFELLPYYLEADVRLLFAFSPDRYHWSWLELAPWYIGWGAAVWTFVTYAFLHGSLAHLMFNLVWLLAFGTAVARRFGPFRFASLFLFAAIAGAAFHLAVRFNEGEALIGASAAISGMMGAAIRFVFQRGGPLAALRGEEPGTYQVLALPLRQVPRDPVVLVVLLMWFGLNFLFGQYSSALLGVGDNIAWEAHIGGFLAGFLGFGLFDSVSAPPEQSERPEQHDRATDETELVSQNDRS